MVNFIVRAVDDVLQTEFGLPDGLADTSKVTIDWDTGQTRKGKAVTIRKEVHRVQILDPATGTGTFLAEVIKQIAPKVKDVAEGMWSPYIETRPDPPPARLRAADGLLRHVPHEAGHDPDRTGLQAHRHPAAPGGLSDQLAWKKANATNADLFLAQWLSHEVKRSQHHQARHADHVRDRKSALFGHFANKGDWIWA